MALNASRTLPQPIHFTYWPWTTLNASWKNSVYYSNNLRRLSPSSLFLIFDLTLPAGRYFTLSFYQPAGCRADMPKKRSSGFDFADRRCSNHTNNTLEQDPLADLAYNGSVHLQRNCSERKRLQGRPICLAHQRKWLPDSDFLQLIARSAESDITLSLMMSTIKPTFHRVTAMLSTF